MSLLHSKILGEGQPLVILHGFLGMSDNWKTLGNRYSENGLQVHLIDQRNHGKSFWSPTFDYGVLAEDLKYYLDHQRLTDVLLMGHSMGGKTAMQFACLHPGYVKKLLIADIAPKFYPPHHDEIINALNELDLHKIDSRGEADEQLKRNIRDFGIRQFLLKNLYWVEKGSLAFRFNLEVLSGKMEEVGENIGSTDTFVKPVLFLRGDRSEYISLQDMPQIKKHFPKARIETVEKAGHWLHAENPGQFFEKTWSFITENG